MLSLPSRCSYGIRIHCSWITALNYGLFLVQAKRKCKHRGVVQTATKHMYIRLLAQLYISSTVTTISQEIRNEKKIRI